MDGYVRIGTKLDTKSFEAQIDYIEGQLQEIEHKLKQADMSFEVGDTQKLEAQYEKLVNQLENLRKKQADINKADLTNIQKSIDKVGDSTSNVIKKVGKWALAVFGIRSAYMFVRNAMGTLSQYNEQIKADTEYISYALASMMQPVIERMIQLAYKLLTYINYIAKAWFGVDLFANASADAMSKSAKSAEKMKKSLAGFDEMNVLNDNGTTGAMGATVPSMDLSVPEDVPIPKWIQWIADNKDIVIAGLAGIASGLIAVHFGLTLIQGLGIGLALGGIIFAIQNLIKFIKDPSFESFTNVIIGIGVAITGVGLIIGGIPAIIAGVITTVVGLVVKNYDSILELFERLVGWFETEFIGALHSLFGPIGDIIAQPFIFAVNYVKGMFEGVYGGIRNIVTGIVKIFKGDFKGGLKQVFGGLKDILLAPFNAMASGINSLIRGINKIKFDVPDWVPGIGGKKLSFNIPQIPKLAVGGIVNMPSKGVPIGSAIAGESGAEGVIPLTNSQAMETLGQAIGKYINISATVPVYVGNKQIAREIKKINAESDFAFNR